MTYLVRDRRDGRRRRFFVADENIDEDRHGSLLSSSRLVRLVVRDRFSRFSNNSSAAEKHTSTKKDNNGCVTVYTCSLLASKSSLQHAASTKERTKTKKVLVRGLLLAIVSVFDRRKQGRRPGRGRNRSTNFMTTTTTSTTTNQSHFFRVGSGSSSISILLLLFMLASCSFSRTRSSLSFLFAPPLVHSLVVVRQRPPSPPFSRFSSGHQFGNKLLQRDDDVLAFCPAGGDNNNRFTASTRAFRCGIASRRKGSLTAMSMSSSSTDDAVDSALLEEVLKDDAFLDRVLDVAVEASKKAGKIILEHHGGASPSSAAGEGGTGNEKKKKRKGVTGVQISERKANSRDLLTLVDPMCEAAIKEVVLKAFPTHDFLGEEDVPPGKEASAAALETKLSVNATKTANKDLLWIVDPIDGTLERSCR